MKMLVLGLVIVAVFALIYFFVEHIDASDDPVEKKKRKEAKKAFKRYDGVPYGGKVPNPNEPDGEPLSLADTIIESLETRPQDWSFKEDAYIRHKPSKRTLWISNGPECCTGYNVLYDNKSIGFIQPEDRPNVWRAAKRVERENGKASEHEAAKRLL